MIDSVATSPRRAARISGFAYLFTILAGVFAEVGVRASVIVRNDPAATAANILAHPFFYRLGLVADLVMLVSYVAVTVLFYALFKPAGRNASLLAAWFSLMGITVLAVNCLNHAAPLFFLDSSSSPYLHAFDTRQLQAFALLALKFHSWGYSIAGVFFGIYCVLIGYLVYRSGFLPAILGVLMAIGGLSYLVDSVARFLSPALSSQLPDVMVLGGVAELALCLFLMVKGVDVARWQAKAAA